MDRLAVLRHEAAAARAQSHELAMAARAARARAWLLTATLKHGRTMHECLKLPNQRH